MELSFREKLKAGLFEIKKELSIHKFKGKYTLTEEGYCDYEVLEGNYFLLKESRHRKLK